MGPVEKLAHRRLVLLDLTEQPGNMRRDCWRGGVDWASCCQWTGRFQLQPHPITILP